MSNCSENNIYNEIMILPLIPLRGTVVFPNSVVSFDVGRDKSIKALEYAADKDIPVFLTSQKNPTQEEPDYEDVYKMGTVTKIKQTIRLPGNMLRVLAEGLFRAEITSFNSEHIFMQAEIKIITEDEVKDEADLNTCSLVRTAQEAFEEYSALTGRLSPEIIMQALMCELPGALADLIASHLFVLHTDKQQILEKLDYIERLNLSLEILYKELNILNLQKEIYSKVKVGIEKNQKEYYLKEQIKVIQEELGEKEGIINEIQEIRNRIEKEKIPEYVSEKLEKELKRLERINNISAEANVIRDYVDLLVELPWGKKSKESADIKRAEDILNKEHYGLEKVKERIVEFLAVRQMSQKADVPILCLVGPPGVGKTSIAQSVAKSLNRKYVRMSLGGVRDEAEIRGHRKTYVGAMPGRIISSLKQAKTNNPLILFDEIDKLGNDFRGDPSSALLEVLDSEQNISFRDHYLELPFDLSDVLFMCTANTVTTIPDALRDRLEIINLSSYTEDEKFNIATKFLINKQLKKHGLKRNIVKIDDSAVSDVIKYYTREAGVRQLERYIGSLCRKAVKQLLTDKSKKTVTFTSENIEGFLGKRKYRIDKKIKNSEIGIARGLAWTSLGGETLSVEVNTMKGTGKFELTGSIGDVMKESAHAAISYIRSASSTLNISKKFYKDTDIHIHIPEGAVPKDGPSAGITMATAMISALTGIPVKNDVGMTGEITIRGRILPIGGLKEKVLAAKNAGLRKVIIPIENDKDLNELPESIKENMEFILAENMSGVLEHSLENFGINPIT